MKSTFPFFPDVIRKCSAIFLAVMFVTVCWASPAELKPLSPSTFKPLLFELDSIEKQLERLLVDWGETTFQIDDVLIQHVSYFIKYYAVADVQRSNKAIRQSKKYLRNIKYFFRKYKIPEDVAFALPFVESSFNPNARSSAGAVGMFQFMDSAAQAYGLAMIDSKKDERLDYKKAAQACARYLQDNKRVFSSTILSLASYHHGTRTVVDVLLTCGDESERKFGSMFQSKRLGPFSREYIPQCLAAALIYRYLENSKLIELAVPTIESRNIRAPKLIKSFENQIPNLRHINPDLNYAKETYSYASTNGYLLLTKVDYPPLGASMLKKFPKWAHNPKPSPPGNTKVKGLPKTIEYTLQSHNDLQGLADIFGTSVKKIKFSNYHLVKRGLRAKDIIKIKGMAPTTQIMNGQSTSTVCGLDMTIETLENETIETFCKRVEKTIRTTCTASPWEMGTGLTPELIYYWNHDALGEIHPNEPMQENLNLKIYSDYQWYKTAKSQ